MANGNFAGGDGSAENPYLIKDAFDLNAVRNDLTAHYKLINDIDLDIAPFNEDKGWDAINNFRGIINGEFHIISNLKIINNKDYQGLFGNNFHGKLIKLYLLNIDIDCASSARVGGLAGQTRDEAVVEDVLVTGSIIGNGYTGGLIGANRGKVHRVISECMVYGGDRTGGIIGNENGELKNSISRGKVARWTSSGTAGGAVGQTYQSHGSVENVLSISECDIGVHGLVSGYGDGKVVNSFWDKNASGVNSSGKGIGITTEEAQNVSTFVNVGWSQELNDDGDPAWILEDSKYPRLWFEKEPYTIIKVDNIYYSYKDNEFIEVEPTEENFEEYSVNLMELLTPNKEGIKPLMTLENPEVVCLTDKENPKLHINGYRDLRPLMESENPKLLISSEVEPEIKVTYHPTPQLILPTGDIVLKMLDKIYDFTIRANKNNGGNIKIICSIDSGTTWLTYNEDTEEFESIDIDNIENIKENGIDPDLFNTIGGKWNEIVTNAKIRFAYYLEIDDINDIAEIDELEVEMDMYGRWKKAEHRNDYDYEYDNEHIYVSFFKDGSYKVNYQE